METFLGILVIIGLIVYIVEVIMNPDKHKGELIIFTIIAAILGGFSDGAKRKKRR